MTYDFETLFPSQEQCGYVWDHIQSCGITDPEAISYAVAEMKFPLAPAVKAALHNCVETGYFGYGQPRGYAKTVCDYMLRRHGWRPQEDWIISTHGVVLAIAVAIRALTEPGDGVIIQTPVYNHFEGEVSGNGRTVVENALVPMGDRYEIDFADLEEKASRPDVKMMVLCSPHNPVGRVWSREELLRIHEICLKNGVTVVSDEIHHDLVYEGKHSIFASLSKEAEQNCIVCTAPSKTFNIPGLLTSNIIIPNDSLREKFRAESEKGAGQFMNLLGVAAGTAAYEDCDEWLDELIAYLKENADYFRRLVAEKLPKAWTPKMEGTYLAWLDLRYLGLNDEDLKELVVKKAQLLVNMGLVYGANGSGFVRVNIGCPRRYIKHFVDRLADAIESL